MTMLDRGVAGSDDETVALARKDFLRRQRSRRWRAARPWVLVLLALAAIGSGVWLVWFSSVMVVSGVEVRGVRDVNPVRVEKVAKVPEGRQLARVDLGAIKARVETIPAVAEADVSRSWPDTVQITVTERIPVAVVDRGTDEEGVLNAVDDSGVLFHEYDERPEGLPLIRTGLDVRAEALAEAARVISSLPASVAAQVDYLDVRSVDRIELQLHDDRSVLWGSAESSGQKAEVLAVLLERPGKQFDVSVPSRPTSR